MPQFSTRRRVRHPAAEMFDLVADVERYPEFVPFCKALKLKRRSQDAKGRDGHELLRWAQRRAALLSWFSVTPPFPSQ